MSKILIRICSSFPTLPSDIILNGNNNKNKNDRREVKFDKSLETKKTFIVGQVITRGKVIVVMIWGLFSKSKATA